MLDTTHEILAKQREIIFHKTIKERFLVTAEAPDDEVERIVQSMFRYHSNR